MISSKRWGQSKRDGKSAEGRFKKIFPSSTEATRDENMFSHVDFWLETGEGVDVKGNNYPDEVWVEIKNVRGALGWLYGEATFFAFEVYELGGFLMVDANELRQFVSANVSKEYTTKDNAFLKLYRRAERMDTITKVTIKELLELSSTILIPYERSYLHPEKKEVINF